MVEHATSPCPLPLLVLLLLLLLLLLALLATSCAKWVCPPPPPLDPTKLSCAADASFSPARRGACRMHTAPCHPPRSLPMPLLRHSLALAPPQGPRPSSLLGTLVACCERMLAMGFHCFYAALPMYTSFPLLTRIAAPILLRWEPGSLL